MSWHLFKVVSVDVEPVVHELRRLADGLEAYLRLAYNYNLTPPKPIKSDTPSEPESVGYSDDEALALAELRDQFETLKKEHGFDTED